MMQKIAVSFCIIVLSLLSIRPLFSSGFFPMHDDAQVARVVTMAKALSHGQFPVRIVADLGYGYGYPIFNFYGPLPYYIGGLLNLVGMDALSATKIMIGLGVLLGSISIYVFSSSLFGIYGGLISTVLFTYFPYRAVQLYVRGAIGELWAISLLPFVLWGMVGLGKKHHRILWFAITTLSLSGVILSHTVFGYVTAASILGVAILYILIAFVRKKHVGFVPVLFIGSCVLALGLTAFFWLPAIGEMNYTNVSKVIGKSADYKDHYICFPQLWDSPWGFGGSASGCLDGMSFKLGKVHIIMLFLTLILWLFSKEKNKQINIWLTGMIFLCFGFLFLTLSISESIWSLFPFSSFIQYPWRFLGPVGLFLTVFSGYLFFRKKGVLAVMSLAVLSGIIFLVNAKLFTPQYLYERPISAYVSTEELRFRASKVSDEYLPKGFMIPLIISEIPHERVPGNDGVSVQKITETEVNGLYELNINKNTELKLNMAYFPGWKYYLNGTEVKLNVVAGQPYMILSAGHVFFEMRFVDTPIRRVGNLISFISLVGLGIITLYGKKIISHYRNTRI